MKKIAFFVEGQTEQIFIEELLTQLIGQRKLVIDKFKFFGGSRTTRNPVTIRAQTVTEETLYYFMIYDCGQDNQVQSDIRKRIQFLIEEKFCLVLGVRDVFPEKDLNALRFYANFGFSQVDIPVKIIFAVNEIEGWFLAEENHYARLSSKLNVDIAISIIGFDIRECSTESIEQPSKVLQKVYNYANIGYQKHAKQVQRTVNALDYENLYFNVINRNASFNELLTNIDSIFGEQNDA